MTHSDCAAILRAFAPEHAPEECVTSHEISTREIQGEDDGYTEHRVICPRCHDTVALGGYYSSGRCSCGFSWDVDVVATGRK